MKIGHRGFGLNRMQRRRPSLRRQRGSLVVVLLMLVSVLMLGISAAQIALHGEKGARNDRDRQIAFQAAEAALMDAELDIQNSPDPGKSRSHIFSKESALGFPAADEPACNSGESNVYLGLCRSPTASLTPAWQVVDFTDTKAASASAVPYGKFTGQRFQASKGSLPTKPPRYIIELLSYNKQGESAAKASYFYRITAVGFGARETTQVALQSFYRKEGM